MTPIKGHTRRNMASPPTEIIQIQSLYLCLKKKWQVTNQVLRT